LRRSAPRIGMVSRTNYTADPRVRRQAEALVAHGYAVDVICQRELGRPAVEKIGGVTVRRIGSLKYQGGSVTRYALSFGSFILQVQLILVKQHWTHGYAAVQVYSM